MEVSRVSGKDLYFPSRLHALGPVFKDKTEEDLIRYREAIIVGHSD